MRNKINSVAKGDSFENIVFNKMKELLESEMLGLSPKYSKIFQKKAYFGKTGNKIIFDIAIESYPPDSDEYSTLTLIECKDYKYPIEVDKVRNFASSIDDVGGHKGYFITTSHFQIGAINHAKSCKIGLAKFNINNLDIEKWILRRVGYQSHQRRQAIFEELNSSTITIPNNFVAICEFNYYSNFLDFVSEQLMGKLCKINVDYLSNETIESNVASLLTKMQYQSDIPRSTNLLIDIITKELDLKLIIDQPLPHNELGVCNFKEKTINISPTLQYDSPRWRFTLAHEIGHYILHESMCSQNMVNSIYDDEASLDTMISDNTPLRLEIQANKFAVYLLIPEKLFIAHYALKHKQLNIPRFPYLYLDNQPCNIKDCLRIFSHLGSLFNISNEMIKIKLKDMGYLSINESIKNMRDFI